MSEPTLEWKMGSLLEREGVTVYTLNHKLVEAGQGVSRTTLYRLANEQPERIDLGVAAKVLAGLQRITGKRYSVSDLLEYKFQDAPEGISAAGIPYTGDPETDAILDEHPDILERIKRVEAGEERLIPLRDMAEELGIKL